MSLLLLDRLASSLASYRSLSLFGSSDSCDSYDSEPDIFIKKITCYYKKNQVLGITKLLLDFDSTLKNMI